MELKNEMVLTRYAVFMEELLHEQMIQNRSEYTQKACQKVSEMISCYKVCISKVRNDEIVPYKAVSIMSKRILDSYADLLLYMRFEEEADGSLFERYLVHGHLTTESKSRILDDYSVEYDRALVKECTNITDDVLFRDKKPYLDNPTAYRMLAMQARIIKDAFFRLVEQTSYGIFPLMPCHCPCRGTCQVCADMLLHDVLISLAGEEPAANPESCQWLKNRE